MPNLTALHLNDITRVLSRSVLRLRVLPLMAAAGIALSLLLAGCDAGGANEEREEERQEGNINSFIQNLSYDPNALLNVQATGAGSSQREPGSADTTMNQEGNFVQTCVRTTYNLKQNFDNIAILRPTSDVIWPGALVKGNESLMDGLPEPVRLSRSPVTIRIDLPGMGANGTRTVESPNLGSLQTAIDEALEWWNANAYQDGYVNASSSSSRVTSSYRSTQAALDVGLNVAWATGDVSTQFNYETSEQKHVVMAAYKQAFYTVSFVQEPGTQPADVFGNDVSLSQVENAFSSAAPPAYISSVTYGRIIMFRMETSSSYTSAEVEAAFRYAAGTSVEADLEARYQEILSSSTVEVITLGGNAEVASEAVSARSAGDLLPIIQGENAVYSRNNPGVPIAYAVKYLKNDRLAKLGYTTEYTATECSSVKTQDTIRIFLDKFYVAKDCDGIEGDGEFSFSARIYNGSGAQIQRVARGVTLGDRGSSEIDRETVFEIERIPNRQFRIEFASSERDKNIFGTTYNDDRMDGRNGVVRHTFGSSGWTNLNGGATIKIVNGSGNCQAELWYTARVI